MVTSLLRVEGGSMGHLDEVKWGQGAPWLSRWCGELPWPRGSHNTTLDTLLTFGITGVMINSPVQEDSKLVPYLKPI